MWKSADRIDQGARHKQKREQLASGKLASAAFSSAWVSVSKGEERGNEKPMDHDAGQSHHEARVRLVGHARPAGILFGV